MTELGWLNFQQMLCNIKQEHYFLSLKGLYMSSASAKASLTGWKQRLQEKKYLWTVTCFMHTLNIQAGLQIVI